MLGLAYSLAAQLQLTDPRGFRLPKADAFEAQWRGFRLELENGLDYEAILQSDEALPRLFLLAALCCNPSLCPLDGPSSKLENHIITRLSESLFGQESPPPVCLILFQMDDAWDFLCEPASLEAILGGAWLLRRAMSLDQPLEQLSKHCHLRAAPDESLLVAARLVDDCLLLNTCTQGLIIAPSASAAAMCDAISRFVAVATLSSSVRCKTIETYPIEIAFGYRARKRWFGDFLSDVEQHGTAGLGMFGFDVREGMEQSQSALWKVFRKNKQFTELVNLAILDRALQRPIEPPRNRYEAFGLLAHCTECYARPASFGLSDGRLLCEPCSWKVSVGTKVIENAKMLNGRFSLSNPDSLAAVFVGCDPFSVFAEPASALSAISAARDQQKAVEEALREVENSLSDSCIINRLSPSEALLIVRRGDAGRCLEVLRNALAQRLAAAETGGSAVVRMGASAERLRAPVGVLVRDAVSSAFLGNEMVLT
ncbi:MAG: hypothetical protein DRH70_05170 [Candidatus Coatesbacteria bacterium]|nr:MAG: hypothetical protein DRH70_05170 [Candidatus Coatesbacteria bacterium]